jgi:Fe2+ transport system protein FeoA
MDLKRWIARALAFGGSSAARGAARRSRIAPEWLRVREEAAGSSSESPRAAGATLVDLEPAEVASVVALGGGTARRLGRLSAFGLAPGARVKLIQKKPAVVIEVGGTRLALEAGIASTIRIARSRTEP